MKKLGILFAVVVLSLISNRSANAVQRIWANSGTDFNATASWNGAIAGNVAFFNAAEVTQPNVSAAISVVGLYFSGTTSSGYDITSTASAALTLTGQDTSGSGGTANGSAAAIRNEITSGTNTVDAPIVLASSTGSSTFVQTGAGTLVVNGAVSGNALSLRGGAGVIQLNGNNSFTAGSIDTAGETVVVGNNAGLGAGTFTVSNTGTIQAGGGARTLANNMVLAANTTISGSNAFTFNGSVTSSGSNSRSLTVSNTGGTTINGTIFLSESNASVRSLTIGGTTAVVINGVITNNNVGNTLASSLSYNGTGSLTLANTNTYSGGTFLSGGSITATKDGAFGSGNVSLTSNTVTLTLQGGATNNYIADTATLNLFQGATATLNFSGSDTVSSLIINNVTQAPGVYNASTNPTVFFGTGSITVIPEPATYMLMGLGILMCAQRFRGRKS